MEQVFDTSKDRLEEVRWTRLCRLNSRCYLSIESTQRMHSHLSTARGDAGLQVVEKTAKCTKLKVLKFSGSPDDINLCPESISFSARSFLNVLNKSTSLQTLSLERVQLSDMVSPP